MTTQTRPKSAAPRRGSQSLVALFVILVAWGPWTRPALGQDGAEEGASAPKRVWSDSVVVTAARLEEEEEEVPANVTVLSRQEIRLSAAQTVDDLLRQVPGFSLFRRASSLVAHPTSQGVSLRGIGPSGVSRTLVLMDGVPLNDPFGGWVYWSRAPLESLERIEVVRGGGSNVWGNFALGGVIHLITSRREGLSFNLLARGGDRDTAHLDVSGGRSVGPVSFLLRGGHFETGGYKTLRRDQRGAIDVNADSRHDAFGGRLDYTSSPSVTSHVTANYFDEDRGNGTPLTGNGTRTAHFSAGSTVTTGGGSTWTGTLFSQLQNFDSTFSAQQADRSSESPALNQFDVDSTAFGGSLQWSRSVAGEGVDQVLTAGGEARWIDGTTNEDFRFFPFTRRRRAGGDEQLAGVYLQDSFSPGSRWQIQAGARVDVWRSRDGSRVERSLENGDLTRQESFENRRETAVSPKLAVLYEASDAVHLRGSLYRAFRAPTINELFRPFRVRNDITEANAVLEPERLVGGELGLDYRQRRLGFRLTGFWNEVQDPISNVTLALGPGVIAPCGFVPGGGSCRQRQNLDRTRIRGLESELELRPNPWWSVSASYLHSDAEVRSATNQPEVVGRRIAQVPRNQVVVRLAHTRPERLSVSLQGRWIDDQFEDDLNLRQLESFTVVDLALSRTLRKRWDLVLGVENILDREYEVGETGAGLVTVGMPRQIHGGVRFRLRR